MLTTSWNGLIKTSEQKGNEMQQLQNIYLKMLNNDIRDFKKCVSDFR